jgi:hypothetical protein
LKILPPELRAVLPLTLLLVIVIAPSLTMIPPPSPAVLSLTLLLLITTDLPKLAIPPPTESEVLWLTVLEASVRAAVGDASRGLRAVAADDAAADRQRALVIDTAGVVAGGVAADREATERAVTHNPTDTTGVLP